jgi:Family of unknown function (DUF5994)
MAVITQTTTLRGRSAIGNLRLRLKPSHRSCGFVQGAWWPRSTLLAAEIPPLLAAISLRLGAVDVLRYHQSDWSPTPQSIEHQGSDVILDPDHAVPHAICLIGKQFGRLTLLVVPPYTEPTHAYTAMTTAASVNDASTPDQLLGTGTRRPKDTLRPHCRSGESRGDGR